MRTRLSFRVRRMTILVGTALLALGVYWGSYLLLMVRDFPLYDASGRIVFYSAAKYPVFRGEEIGRFVQTSWLNYLYLPADYLYYKNVRYSYLVTRSRDSRYSAEFVRFY